MTSPALAAGTATTGPRRIGLVLGGGGARGFAHIGVLRALEEKGFEPDSIFGVSMGGLIGAFAASRMGHEEIRRIFHDNLGPRALAAGRGGSFLGSGRIARILKAHLCERFEDLAIPLAVATVDLHRGELVILDRGKLPLALRATIAIPGVLPAIEWDGKALADGGVLNNLPVDLIRERTDSPIVAVDVSEPVDRPIDIAAPSLWQQLQSLVAGRRPLTANLFMKAFLIPQAQLTRERLERCPPDLLIRPDLDPELGMEDFLQSDEAIEAGYQAALRALPAQS